MATETTTGSGPTTVATASTITGAAQAAGFGMQSERATLVEALEAHKRTEVVEELAEQAETLRRALGKIFGETHRLINDPTFRDDLAFELSSVLRVINGSVRELGGSQTINLDDLPG